MMGLTGGTAGQSADSVVDLGEEGLSEGDRIDEYLEEYFESGVEVRVPAGEYEYHGSGFGGSRGDAAVVGQGEVVLINEAGAYREDIEATDGVVAVRNVTLRGKSGPEETRFRLTAEEEARVVVDNLNLPDGGDARGFYVPSGHAGVIEIRNCYVANNSEDGIHASSAAKGANGRLIVENCFLHNNGTTGIRLGSSESAARNCLVLNDGKPPVCSASSHDMRGIGVQEPGEDIVIEDCEIVHSDDGAGGPIELHDEAEGGTGSIRNVLIRNETDTDAINGKGNTADCWTAESVSIVGDGNLEYPANFDDVCVGDDCPAPTGENPRQVETDDPGDDRSIDGRGENWKTVVFDGTAADTITAYSFRVTGEVVRDDAISTDPDGNRWDEIDDIVDDDSVSGVVSKGIDGYRYTGNLVALDFDGAAAVTIDDC
ncbi:MAG: right-handed parallel beta-helix repeat-containing protein [Natrialbaceae archaeon]